MSEQRPSGLIFPERPKKFTRHDIQEWINTLGERESAMLAHVVGEAEYRAGCETLREAAEHCAQLARKLAAEDRKTRSKAVRSVVGVLLTLHRNMENAARLFSDEAPVQYVDMPKEVQ